MLIIFSLGLTVYLEMTYCMYLSKQKYSVQALSNSYSAYVFTETILLA